MRHASYDRAGWRNTAPAEISDAGESEEVERRQGPKDQGQHLYSPEARANRLIAGARLALAAFSLVAVWFDPTRPARYGGLVQALMVLYSVYALATLAVVRRGPAPLRYPLITHVLDLLVLSALLVLSSGASSPLFPFFTFALAAAALRWQRRGAFLTAAATMAVLAGTAVYAADTHSQAFELNDLVIRLASVAVIAVLLGDLGAYEARMRRDMDKLASEAEAHEGDPHGLVRYLPRWAAACLNAPRALVAWEESEEPWVHLAWWDGGESQYAREPPGVMALVAEDLVHVDFLCRGAGGPTEPVLHMSPDGFKWWRGEPLQPALRQRFSVTSVLSVRFEVEAVSGRLFLFDKPGMTSDHLLLARIVARHIGNRLNHVYLMRHLAERVVLEERVGLARDLHDGALHALAAVALELEALLRTSEFELPAARSRLREIQASLEAEQRTLRMLIGHLKASSTGGLDPGFSLSAGVKDLVERVERQWGLKVQWREADLDVVPQWCSGDVYLLVREMLLNAARHAGASVASLKVALENGHVTIAAADNGHGFGFKGRYDHATLARLQVGPATLRERAALLGGTLSVDSTERGARIEISFPVEPFRP